MITLLIRMEIIFVVYIMTGIMKKVMLMYLYQTMLEIVYVDFNIHHHRHLNIHLNIIFLSTTVAREHVNMLQQ